MRHVKRTWFMQLATLLLCFAIVACAAPVAAPSAPAAAPAAGTTEGTTAAGDLPPVELSYYFIGWPVQDLDKINAAVNKITQEKINATVKLNLIDWGSYNDKMKVVTGSGEPCDVMLMSWLANTYASNVAAGTLLPLDDLLPKYAPTLWASMPQDVWASARSNGKIYGAINQWFQVSWIGGFFRKDLMDKYGFDINTVKKWEDLEPFYDQILAQDPDVTPVISTDTIHGKLWQPTYWGFDPLGSPDGVFGIALEDGKLKVSSLVESEEYKHAVDLAHSWYEKGYYTPDPLPDGDMQAGRAAGKYGSMLVPVRPGIEDLLKYNEYGGRDMAVYGIADPVMTTDSVTQAMTGICANSKNPERAMMFIELLNTDKDLLNLLTLGIEGEHWVWKDQAKNQIDFPPGKTAEEVFASYRAPEWAFGNVFNTAYRYDSEVGSHEKMAELNASAAKSPALGLSIDYSNVKTEFAQVEAVAKQYGFPLEIGLVDPATGIPEYVAKLKEAGLDTLIAEAQRQVDAWAAAK
jgi:putative aldouronate transport system substrate-binding protein